MGEFSGGDVQGEEVINNVKVAILLLFCLVFGSGKVTFVSSKSSLNENIRVEKDVASGWLLSREAWRKA